MMTEPGENPSPWFCAVVSTCTPLTFAGSTFDEMLSRRPVVVLARDRERVVRPRQQAVMTDRRLEQHVAALTAASGMAAFTTRGVAEASDGTPCRAEQRRRDQQHSPERDRLANPNPSLHESPRRFRTQGDRREAVDGAATSRRTRCSSAIRRARRSARTAATTSSRRPISRTAGTRSSASSSGRNGGANGGDAIPADAQQVAPTRHSPPSTTASTLRIPSEPLGGRRSSG